MLHEKTVLLKVKSIGCVTDQSLGREDPLEQEMAIHSNILAWKIPWTDEPGGQQSMGSRRVRHDLATKLRSSQMEEMH